MAHNFGPACKDEATVFGASRPGYNSKSVSPAEAQEWIRFMQDRGIERVVCLLPENQLAYYPEDLLKAYRETFGSHNVCHAPVCDYFLSSAENLKRVLEFLAESDRLGKKTVVHCSGGSGRTGHVLAAWLVHATGLDPHMAIKAVQGAEPPRNPTEAVCAGNASQEELNGLLSSAGPTKGGEHG